MNKKIRARERRYGITDVEYRALERAQMRQCAGCRTPLMMFEPRAVHVDHDHDTGMVRGILCQQCNHAVGLMNDSFQVASNLSGYLRTSSMKGSVI